MKSIKSKTHSFVNIPSLGNIGPLYRGFGFKDDNTTTSKEAETGKAKLFNQRALAYGEKLKVNKDGYKVLDIIDNEDDYEEFLSDYEFAYQAKSSIKRCLG